MSKSSEYTGTCVVLVCVTNKQNKVLTHDKFFKTFSQFGRIQRILIFERAIIWKTFVEYDNTGSANKARVQLNGQDFGDDGLKMNVYASQLERITFQENNSGGVDYTILRQKIEEKSQKSQGAQSPSVPTHSQMFSVSNTQAGIGNQTVTANNKSYSQTTSPLYSKQPAAQNNISQSAQFSYNNQTTQSFAMGQVLEHQQQQNYSGHSTYPSSFPPQFQFGQVQMPQNYQYQQIQQQMQFQQFMQQPVQKINHLMFMLSQINSEQSFQVQMSYNQPYYEQNVLNQQQLLERQLSLLKELQETYFKGQQLVEQYQGMLSQFSTTLQQSQQQQAQFQYQPVVQRQGQFGFINSGMNGYPNSQIQDIGSSAGSLGMSPKPHTQLIGLQRSDARLNSKVKASIPIDNNQWGITAPEVGGQQEKIQFIKSLDNDSSHNSTTEHQKDIDNILQDQQDDQLLKLASKEFKKQILGDLQNDDDDFNFDGISVKDSVKDDVEDQIEDDRDSNYKSASKVQRSEQKKQQDEQLSMKKLNEEQDDGEEELSHDEKIGEQDLFNCFKSNNQLDGGKLDTQSIFAKLNYDMKSVDEVNKQQVLAIIESDIQQNSNQKSSHSVEQIDQLINISKQKDKVQNALFQQQQIVNVSLSPTSTKRQQPEWSQQQVQKPGEQGVQLYDDVTEDLDPAEYVNPLFLKVVRKSRVIYSRWFDKKIVTLKMLYNIFSTFGNIDKMIYLKDRSSALLQYQTIEHATLAKDSLNDIMFYGQSIKVAKIFYSNYEEIYLKSNFMDRGDPFGQQESQEEYFQGSEETNRFKQDHTYAFNPPSDTIQVGNLTKESCSPEGIFPIFQTYAQIIKHKFVFHASNRNSCILKYNDVETSLMVLANLHNISIDGRVISIQFSKQKL